LSNSNDDIHSPPCTSAFPSKVSQKIKNKLKNLLSLKVPKCEIFDHSDFHDFYIIKSLSGGEFGVTLNFFFIFRGLFRAAKFLTRMLSLIQGGFFLKFGLKNSVVERL
jgi:hypothetical protein